MERITMRPRRITTTDGLLNAFEQFATLGKQIMKTKNQDYGDHANNDPFANFRRHGTLGILVRMDDKLARLTTFSKTGKLSTADEGVIDSAVDLMNYAAILVAYILDEQARDPRDPGELVVVSPGKPGQPKPHEP